MIIKGPEVHESTWERLSAICQILFDGLQSEAPKLISIWELGRLDDAPDQLDKALDYLEAIYEDVKSKNSKRLREMFDDFFEIACFDGKTRIDFSMKKLKLF
jgi:hypothetical protein